MKREEIILRAEMKARKIFKGEGANIKVCTNWEEYPKVFVCNADEHGINYGPHLTPSMRPSELSAYLSGMQAQIERTLKTKQI